MASDPASWQFHFTAGTDPAHQARVDGMILGVDPSAWQGAIDWLVLRRLRKWFAIPKAIQGTLPSGAEVVAGREDQRFAEYWQNTKAAGMVRGAYHFVGDPRVLDAAGQVAQFVASVPRLQPGDLPPSLDIEADGTNRLEAQPDADVAAALNNWLVGIEKALGRRPMVYVGSYYKWHIQDNGLANAFSNYIPWIVDVNNLTPRLLGWSDWTFWQYGEDNATYHEVGIGGAAAGIDFNAFRGTVHELRGFADLGAPAVTSGGVLVYGQPDTDLGSAPSTLVSFQLARGGEAVPLTDGNGAPLVAAGDPFTIPGTNCVLWRSANDKINAIDTGGDRWTPISLHDAARDAPGSASALAFSDPSGFLAGDRLVVLYTDAAGRLHAMWTEEDHSWSHVDIHAAVAGLPVASSGASGLFDGADWRIVYRTVDGGLYEVRRHVAEGTWGQRDFAGAAGATVAATNEPAVCIAKGSLTVAYRGVGGGIYEACAEIAPQQGPNVPVPGLLATGSPAVYIDRTIVHMVFRTDNAHVQDASWGGADGNPTNWQVVDLTTLARTLENGAQPPNAATDPIVWFTDGTVHVGYRSTDGSIYDMWPADGGWSGQYLRGPD